MAVKLAQIIELSEGDSDFVSIDYTPYLDSGELLSGTPTVAEQTTSDLTIANRAISTAAVEILGNTVAIGHAVQFSVTGQQAGSTYTVRVTIDTDSTPARTKVVDATLVCVD